MIRSHVTITIENIMNVFRHFEKDFLFVLILRDKSDLFERLRYLADSDYVCYNINFIEYTHKIMTII